MSNSVQSPIGEQVKCSCKGYNLDKLLQPNILIILARGNMHGYMIIQELAGNLMIQEDKADNAGVYRALKTLEEKGRVHSEWIFDGAGPAKKEYAITESGRECLRTWVQTLEDYQATIGRIVREGRAVLEGVSADEQQGPY